MNQKVSDRGLVEEFPWLVGSYQSYLLPKQGNGTFQIQPWSKTCWVTLY